MTLIELRGVVKYYRLGQTTVAALRGVDFAVERGDFIAIWGPSGSGKSSLLNLIGLIDRPTEGQVIMNGSNIERLSDDRLAELRNRNIGFVFQNFNLVAVLNAVENVMLPLQIRGVPAAESRRLALEKLEEVGLSRIAGSRPDQMSGGQRQRVAIARALVTQPAIVLADEPTANLDSDTSYQIVSLMRGLNVNHQVTFVFATHDPRLLENISRRVRLEDGRVVSTDNSYVHFDHRTAEHS